MALIMFSSLNSVHNFTRKTALSFIRPLASLTQNRKSNDYPKPPKKPVSSFFDFLLNSRKDIISNNPGISTKDVVRTCAEMYKNLSEGDKKVLSDRAVERMAIYKKQYEAFKSSLTPEQTAALKERNLKKKESKEKKKKKEIERKLNRPKRPMNAYAIFTRASKVERGSTPFVVFSRKLSNLWKNMPTDEKAIYLEEARLERERYAEEMMDWEQMMIEQGQPELIRGYRKPKKPLKKKTTRTKSKKATKAKKPQKRTKTKSKKVTKAKKTPKKRIAKKKSVATQTTPTSTELEKKKK